MAKSRQLIKPATDTELKKLWDGISKSNKLDSMTGVTGILSSEFHTSSTILVPNTKFHADGMTLEIGNQLSCPIHGDDVGISITAEENKTTPKIKLVACRFCMLEKLAKSLEG